MKRIYQKLLLMERFTIKTRHSPEEVKSRVRDLHEEYYGRLLSKGFTVYFKHRVTYGPVFVRNSFWPFAFGRIREEGGLTAVSITVTMHPLVCLLMYPIEFLLAACTVLGGLLCVFTAMMGHLNTEMLGVLIGLIPFVSVFALMLHFAFFRPARKLRRLLEDALVGPEDV